MSASASRSVLVAVVVASFATVATAHADPVFAPATPIGTVEANAGSPSVAANAKGDAVAVWDEDAGGDAEVVASTRDGDGPFSAPVVLSIPGDFAYTPTAVIDAAGNATVVWGEVLDSTGYGNVEVADHPAGGSWGAAQTVARGNAGALAGDPAGDQLLTWTDGPLAATNLRVLYRHHGQPFALGTTPPPLETGTYGSTILPALDAAGDGVIAWTHDTVVDYPNIETHVEAARVASDGTAGAPVSLTPYHASAFSPALVLADSGVATVVSADGDTASGPRSFHARTLAADGTVGPAQPLSGAGADVAALALDPSGAVTAAWTRAVSGTTRVEQATAPAGGTFSQPATLLDADAATSGPAVAAAPNGQTLIAWGHDGTHSSGDAGDRTEQAAFRAAGAATFGLPQTLGTGDDRPSAAIGCQDDAIDVFRTVGAQEPYPMSAATTIDPADHGPSPCAATTTTTAPPVTASVTTPPVSGPPVVVHDTTAPQAKLSGATKQKAGTSISVTVACPSEACTARATAVLTVPRTGKAKLYKLTGAPHKIGAGKHITLKLTLSKAERGAVAKALRGRKTRGGVKAAVAITVTDAAGNARRVVRTIKLTPA
ncbi:MAG: hypothetical protein JWQ18_3290 [Conexibacter sp.]|nr:hypothetical protein [Conexibacter sp.]